LRSFALLSLHFVELLIERFEHFRWELAPHLLDLDFVRAELLLLFFELSVQTI